MGNTCAPESKTDEAEQATDIEKKEQDEEISQPTEKFTKIINTYQAENEKMKKELDSMKHNDEENSRERSKQAEQNDEIMKELAAMKAMMEEKDRALVKHRLEAALHSKATSMVTSETVTKLLKAGNIEKFGKAGKSKAKVKWVEIHLRSAQAGADGVSKGFLMLTYADSQSSQLSNRCQIVRVNKEVKNVAAKLKGRAFSVDVISSGADKELVFGCEDEKDREGWVEACNEGFMIIDEELQSVSDYTTIDVKFSNPKLGIRVEEKVLIDVGVDEEKLAQVALKKTDADKVEEKGNDKDNGLKTVEQEEKPCELIVRMINDDSLRADGLTVDCVVSAINGMNMRGLTYTKQVGLFADTPKPFIITFLKKKSPDRTAFPGILNELVADGDNAVKTAFYELVKGTPFGLELDKSDNKAAAIAELLSNQRRLTAVLQNTIVQEAEL